MTLANTDVLISGASVAGPTLAYWVRRHGFTPTVVERTPALRNPTPPGVQAFTSAASETSSTHRPVGAIGGRRRDDVRRDLRELCYGEFLHEPE
jgi:hypothetical protein